MISIRVQERTSIDDVLAWSLASCDVFRVSRRSSFEPGVQGLALSTLASLRPGRRTPILDCEFPEPKDLAELESTLLSSAFGFAFVRIASQIHFLGSVSSEGFKPLLAALYKTRNGILGSGSSQAIVCPDPVFSLPPALAQAASMQPVDSFPPPSAFTFLLNTIVESMGFRRLLGSNQESSIVAFVYEALRNSLEHGLAVDAARRARSTRALIIEKIVVQKDGLANRRLSAELKQYLERIVESNKSGLGLGVICLTVADQGDGIQSTLPSDPEQPEETPDERLARAFLPGESRKPVGVVQRGLGLPSVISASHNLQALMRVSSGNLCASQDYSIGEDKYPKLEFNAINKLPDSFVSGTCISIFLPEFSVDLDQRSLFPR